MSQISKLTKPLKFAVIFGNRSFFPSHLVESGRKEARELFNQLKINTIMLSVTDTPFGGVETQADSKKCAALFKAHKDEIDGVIVILPNFGDEKAIADSIRLAGLSVPILVQACADDLDKMAIGMRRDSFCGKISLCNNLRQTGLAFTLTTAHVCKINSPQFTQDLERFQCLCRVVKAMRSVRIGAIGARPASFNTVRYSEKLLEKHGISVETIDLSEIIAKFNTLADDDTRINLKLNILKNKSDTSAIPPEKLQLMAKLFVVISQWITDNDIDVTAIQCWTSLQENIGINACAIMSAMSNELMPSACEVDVMGALSMYALASCALKPASLADWNNNYGQDKCVLFHCGNFASDSLDAPKMGCAEIIGTTVGVENTCGAIHGRMKAGSLSYFRLSSDDINGKIKAYTGIGKISNDPLDTVGCRAVAQIPQLEKLLRYICENGFEHHVAINHADVADILKEAFEKYLNIACYQHQ